MIEFLKRKNHLIDATDWLLAIVAGILLAVMIDFNSLLAKHSVPVFASWVAHGFGALVALVIVGLGATLLRLKPQKAISPKPQSPFWSYWGGIPGTFTVILAAITVNSPLGLSGTLALMLVGQVLFGIVSDQFGWFGIPQRKIGVTDGLVILFVLSGSGILIFGGA